MTALAVAAVLAVTPSFALGAPSARPGDTVTVRVANAPRGPMTISMLPGRTFLGTAKIDRRGRGKLTFLVPPVRGGTYELAYRCRRCGGLRLAAADLDINSPSADSGCPVTHPKSDGFYGTAALAAYLPSDGVWVDSTPDDELFVKMLWIGSHYASLTVMYGRIDALTASLRAETVAGTLGGHDGPSWASRMHFDAPGCWMIVGKVGSAKLTAVVKVASA